MYYSHQEGEHLGRLGGLFVLTSTASTISCIVSLFNSPFNALFIFLMLFSILFQVSPLAYLLRRGPNSLRYYRFFTIAAAVLILIIVSQISLSPFSIDCLSFSVSLLSCCLLYSILSRRLHAYVTFDTTPYVTPKAPSPNVPASKSIPKGYGQLNQPAPVASTPPASNPIAPAPQRPVKTHDLSTTFDLYLYILDFIEWTDFDAFEKKYVPELFAVYIFILGQFFLPWKYCENIIEFFCDDKEHPENYLPKMEANSQYILRFKAAYDDNAQYGNSPLANPFYRLARELQMILGQYPDAERHLELYSNIAEFIETTSVNLNDEEEEEEEESNSLPF